MKKVIIVTLVIAILFAFAGCSSDDTDITQPTETTDPLEEIERQLQGIWSCDVSSMVSARYSFVNGRFACETTAAGVNLGAKLGSYTLTEDAVVLKYDESDDTVELQYFFKNGKLTLFFNDETVMKKD